MAVGPLRHVSYAQYEPDVCSWTADYRGMSCAERHFDAIIFGQQMVEACLPPRRSENAVCAALPPPCVRALRARVRHLTSVRSPLNRMVDERIMPLDGLVGHVRLAVAEAPDR